MSQQTTPSSSFPREPEGSERLNESVKAPQTYESPTQTMEIAQLLNHPDFGMSFADLSPGQVFARWAQPENLALLKTYHTLSTMEEKQAFVQETNPEFMGLIMQTMDDVAAHEAGKVDPEKQNEAIVDYLFKNDLLPEDLQDGEEEFLMDSLQPFFTDIQNGQYTNTELKTFIDRSIQEKRKKQEKGEFREIKEQTITGSVRMNEIRGAAEPGTDNRKLIDEMLEDADIKANPELVANLEQIAAKLDQMKALPLNEEDSEILARALNDPKTLNLNAEGAAVFVGLMPYVNTMSEEGKAQMQEIISGPVNKDLSIPRNPEDFSRQLSGASYKEITRLRPDGTTETIREKSFEPIIYRNAGLDVKITPTHADGVYLVEGERQTGLPVKFHISEHELLGGLSDLNWLLSMQSLEVSGFENPFGGGGIGGTEDLGHMKREYHRFSYGLGLRPPEGQMWTQEMTDKAIFRMQSLHVLGDAGQDNADMSWKEKAGKLGIYNQGKNQWNQEALNNLRTWLDGNPAGAVEYEGVRSHMV